MAKLSLLKSSNPGSGTHDSRAASLTVKDIPIGDIHLKANVRKDYTGIDELTESIRRYGLLQPVTLYADDDGYAVKTGHRRYMAYKKLYQEEPEKYHSIRSIVSDGQNAVIIQLVENVQRVDLSQSDLLNSLNQLRDQGMTLKQIAEVIGKTEGYVKSLFVGVNEINRDKDLKSMISDAGITIRDIAETKAVKDKGKRTELLEERKSGKVNRAEMREKVRELSAPKPKKDAHKKQKETVKPVKTHITIKAFPSMNKVILYLKKGGNVEFKKLERDLLNYFSANKENYRVEKGMPGKGDI